MNANSSQPEMSPVVSTPRSHNGCLWMTIIILGLATITSMTAWYVIHTIFVIPGGFAGKIAEEIANGWNKSTVCITIDTTKTRNAKRILDIATYEKTIEEVHEYSTTWFGSTKSFIISCQYKVKYGVATGSVLQFKRVSHQVAQLLNSPISVLSCTPVEGTLQIQTDEGLWNKLTDDERTKAFEQMLSKARQAAESDEAAKELAKHEFCKLLNDQSELKSADISIELP